MSRPGPQEYLYKVLVVGDMGVGKTAVIKQFVHHIFSPHYKSTIGVDFALKVWNWDDRTVVRMQLWDIAGQERFGNMTRVYYKEAVGAIVVYDVTRPATLEAVIKWKNDIDHKVLLPDGQTPIPCILLGNKCDLPPGATKTEQEMQEFCKQNGFIAWYETSAKDDINIEPAMRFLVQSILENDQRRNPARGGANGGGAGSGGSGGADGRQRGGANVNLNEQGQQSKDVEKSGCC